MVVPEFPGTALRTLPCGGAGNGTFSAWSHSFALAKISKWDPIPSIPLDRGQRMTVADRAGRTLSSETSTGITEVVYKFMTKIKVQNWGPGPQFLPRAVWGLSSESVTCCGSVGCASDIPVYTFISGISVFLFPRNESLIAFFETTLYFFKKSNLELPLQFHGNLWGSLLSLNHQQIQCVGEKHYLDSFVKHQEKNHVT